MRPPPLLRSFAVLASLAGTALGQEPAAIFDAAIEVRTVDVDVVVTDRRGRPVAGLGRDDFRLLSDGEPVEIRYFSAACQPEPNGDRRPRMGHHLVVYLDHQLLSPHRHQRVTSFLRGLLQEGVGADARWTLVAAGGGPAGDPELDLEVLEAASEAPERVVERLETLLGGEGPERRPASEARFRELARELEEAARWRRLRGRPPPSGQEQALLERIRAYAEARQGEMARTAARLHRLIGALAGLEGRKTLLWVSGKVPANAPEVLLDRWRSVFGSAGTTDPSAGVSGVADPLNPTETGQTLGQEGRGSLLSGLEAGSFATDAGDELERLAAHANSARVTFYTFDVRDPASPYGAFRTGGVDLTPMAAESAGGEAGPALAPAPQARLESALEHLAERTGGLAWEAGDDGQPESLRRDLGCYYSLGFDTAGSEDGTLHRLEARLVDGRRRRLRYRELYRAESADEEAAAAVRAALLLGHVRDPLGVELWVTEEAAGAAELPLGLRLDAARLTLFELEGEHHGRLSIFVAGGDGAAPDEVLKAQLPVRLGAEAAGGGGRFLEYRLPAPRPAAGASLTVAVRDDLSGRLAVLRLEPAAQRPVPPPPLPPTADTAGAAAGTAASVPPPLADGEGVAGRRRRAAERAEYRRLLAQLAAGATQTSREGLAGLERACLEAAGKRRSATLDDLAELEVHQAKELVGGRRSDLLLPIAALHAEVALIHWRRGSMELASHALGVARSLAEAHATSGTAARRESALFFGDLALGLRAEGLAPQARELLERSLELAPTDPTALLVIAFERERRGRPAEAAVPLRRLLEAHPGHREARLRLGVQLLRLGEAQAGCALLRPLLDDGEEDWITVVAYQELARAEIVAGSFGRAGELLTRAAARFPDHRELLLPLAYAQQRTGRLEQARAALAEAAAGAASERPAPRGRYVEGPVEARRRLHLEVEIARARRRSALAEHLAASGGEPPP